MDKNTAISQRILLSGHLIEVTWEPDDAEDERGVGELDEDLIREELAENKRSGSFEQFGTYLDAAKNEVEFTHICSWKIVD